MTSGLPSLFLSGKAAPREARERAAGFAAAMNRHFASEGASHKALVARTTAIGPASWIAGLNFFTEYRRAPCAGSARLGVAARQGPRP